VSDFSLDITALSFDSQDNC